MKIGTKVRFISAGGFSWSNGFNKEEAYGIVKTDLGNGVEVQIYLSKTKRKATLSPGTSINSLWCFSDNEIEEIKTRRLPHNKALNLDASRLPRCRCPIGGKCTHSRRNRKDAFVCSLGRTN